MVEAIRHLQEQTKSGSALQWNICLSYGSREEMVMMTKAIARQVQDGTCSIDEITEDTLQASLLLPSCPDLVIRTSGEERISNFLLYQIAYAELFFLPIYWPEMSREELLRVLREFGEGRNRRFGK